MTAKRKNTLIAIGYTGQHRVYFNVARDEAIRRYTASEGEPPLDSEVKEIAFDDEFKAYAVWEADD